jgi:hypothetical protein
MPARGLLGGLRAKRWRRGAAVARSACRQPRSSAWRPRLRRRSAKPLLWGAEGAWLTAEPGAPRGSRRLQQQARHDAGGGGVHHAPSAVGAALAGTAAWPSAPAADSTLSRGASAATTVRQRRAPQRRLARG